MRVTSPLVCTLAALVAAAPAFAAPEAAAPGPVPAVTAWAFQPAQGPPQGRGQRQPTRPPRGPQGLEANEPFTRTLRLAPDGTVDLANLAGDIVITGGAGDDVHIQALKRSWHEDQAQARSLLGEMRVLVIERGGTIEVRTDMPRRRDWYGTVEYTVTLPRRAHVTIRTASGNVRVTSVAGELRADSVSGNIIVSAAGRARLLRSVSGNVEISNAEGQELTARSTSGILTARALKVHTIDIETVSGEIRLTDIESTRARISSISGAIDYRGQLARSGHYELVTSSGGIRIAATGTVGFDVDAVTWSGTISSELPLVSTDARSGRRAGGPPARVRGTFGEASAALSLRSFNGDIVIARP